MIPQETGGADAAPLSDRHPTDCATPRTRGCSSGGGSLRPRAGGLPHGLLRAKAELEQHLAGGRIVGRVACFQPREPELLEGEGHHRLRGLEGIALAPAWLLQPVAEFAFFAVDLVEIDQADHAASALDGKSKGRAGDPFLPVLTEPAGHVVGIGWKLRHA